MMPKYRPIRVRWKLISGALTELIDLLAQATFYSALIYAGGAVWDKIRTYNWGGIKLIQENHGHDPILWYAMLSGVLWIAVMRKKEFIYLLTQIHNFIMKEQSILLTIILHFDCKRMTLNDNNADGLAKFALALINHGISKELFVATIARSHGINKDSHSDIHIGRYYEALKAAKVAFEESQDENGTVGPGEPAIEKVFPLPTVESKSSEEADKDESAEEKEIRENLERKRLEKIGKLKSS